MSLAAPLATLSLGYSTFILVILVAAVAGATFSAVIFYLRFRPCLDNYNHQNTVIRHLQTELVRISNSEYKQRLEIERLNAQIVELSKYVEFTRTQSSNDDVHLYPLLAVVGADAATKDDLSSLRQVDVDVLLSYPPTWDAFEKRLNNLRANGRKPRGIHFGLHAGTSGIEFEDQLATIEMLSENINDIPVILIAGCRGSDIGFALSSPTQRVVTCQHNIESEHAALLTRVFWGQIASGKNAVSAYAETKRRLPPVVSELIELH